jgi:hypothetical protein
MPGTVWAITLAEEILKKNSKSGTTLPIIRAESGRPAFCNGTTTEG